MAKATRIVPSARPSWLVLADPRAVCGISPVQARPISYRAAASVPAVRRVKGLALPVVALPAALVQGDQPLPLPDASTRLTLDPATGKPAKSRPLSVRPIRRAESANPQRRESAPMIRPSAPIIGKRNPLPKLSAHEETVYQARLQRACTLLGREYPPAPYIEGNRQAVRIDREGTMYFPVYRIAGVFHAGIACPETNTPDAMQAVNLERVRREGRSKPASVKVTCAGCHKSKTMKDATRRLCAACWKRIQSRTAYDPFGLARITRYGSPKWGDWRYDETPGPDSIWSASNVPDWVWHRLWVIIGYAARRIAARRPEAYIQVTTAPDGSTRTNVWSPMLLQDMAEMHAHATTTLMEQIGTGMTFGALIRYPPRLALKDWRDTILGYKNKENRGYFAMAFGRRETFYRHPGSSFHRPHVTIVGPGTVHPSGYNRATTASYEHKFPCGSLHITNDPEYPVIMTERTRAEYRALLGDVAPPRQRKAMTGAERIRLMRVRRKLANQSAPPRVKTQRNKRK